MKSFKVFLLVGIVFLSSCDWGEKEETLNDKMAFLGRLLPECQLGMVRFSHGKNSVYTSMLMQQTSGVRDELLEIERYNVTTEDMDDLWYTCYLGTLSNLYSVIDESTTSQTGKFRGIAKILMANTLGLASDVWGDMPYSESFISGSGSFTPKYDSQEELYQTIFKLLNEGVADLQMYGEQQFPISEDLFFQGDPLKWINYANFLRLRYNLHLSKINGFEPLNDFIANTMFTGTGNALVVNYATFENVQNPQYLFVSSFSDQLRAGDRLVSLMQGNDDPRLPIFFKKTSLNSYEGSPAGSCNDLASKLSDSLFMSRSKVILASFTEQKFIEAEVYFRLGFTSSALEAFSLAVESSLRDYGVYNDQWLSSYLDGVDLTLEAIINAKYVALFMQPEVWCDWRRTGLPTLQPSIGNSTGEKVPRRFPYPQSEYNYNSANVPKNICITDGVWWDQ